MRIFLSMDILLTCFSSICFFVFVEDEKNLWDCIPKFGEGASFRNICGVLTSYNNQPVDVEKIDIGS